MNTGSMTVRGKVAVELGIIAVLTTIFLLLFPHRNPAVDVGLAGFALLGIAASAGYTKKVIWAASPPPVIEDRFRRCLKVTLWVTAPAVFVFLVAGGIVDIAAAVGLPLMSGCFILGFWRRSEVISFGH